MISYELHFHQLALKILCSIPSPSSIYYTITPNKDKLKADLILILNYLLNKGLGEGHSTEEENVEWMLSHWTEGMGKLNKTKYWELTPAWIETSKEGVREILQVYGAIAKCLPRRNSEPIDVHATATEIGVDKLDKIVEKYHDVRILNHYSVIISQAVDIALKCRPGTSIPHKEPAETWAVKVLHRNYTLDNPHDWHVKEALRRKNVSDDVTGTPDLLIQVFGLDWPTILSSNRSEVASLEAGGDGGIKAWLKSMMPTCLRVEL